MMTLAVILGPCGHPAVVGLCVYMRSPCGGGWVAIWCPRREVTDFRKYGQISLFMVIYACFLFQEVMRE